MSNTLSPLTYQVGDSNERLYAKWLVVLINRKAVPANYPGPVNSDTSNTLLSKILYTLTH